MARAVRKEYPVVTDVCQVSEWTGLIDIGPGIQLPHRVTVARIRDAGYNDPVTLDARGVGVTLYGLVEDCGDSHTTILLNSINPESRYDVIPPQVFVKGVE